MAASGGNLPLEHQGRCLCGACRYSANGQPLWIAHCHCQSCRRATGAAVTTYVGLAAGRFRFIGPEPASYNSSPGVTRRFCPRCGTPLSYETESLPDEVHVHVSTLESAQLYQPQGHVFTVDALPWLHMEDGLPRNPRFNSPALNAQQGESSKEEEA